MRVKRIEPHAVERFIERVLPMTSGPHKSYLSRPGSPEKVLFYIANNQKLERESEGVTGMSDNSLVTICVCDSHL